MRTTEYQTLGGLIDYLRTLKALPDPIVVIADYQHRAVWLNIKNFALPIADEFEKRNYHDSGLSKIHLEIVLDDSQPGWEFKLPARP